MKRYTVIAAICVLLACSPVQANDVSSYINDNLGQFFPDMHSQLPLERSPPPPICSPISGVMTFTTKALRILTFDNRGSDDRLQVEASSDPLSRLITISSAQCRIQFRIFRAEKSSEGEKPLTPFDGSGIPGAEKKQVSSSGSIIEAAAYFPDATKTCGISGLPRSGSTLLSAILRQRPEAQAGMSSPVGPLMQALLTAMGVRSEWSPLVDDNQRRRLLRGVIDNYYGDLRKSNVVFDTNRLWCARLP